MALNLTKKTQIESHVYASNSVESSPAADYTTDIKSSLPHFQFGFFHSNYFIHSFLGIMSIYSSYVDLCFFWPIQVQVLQPIFQIRPVKLSLLILSIFLFRLSIVFK